MHTFRTRFAKDIVAEFLPPARATKKQRVVIICSGAPSVPSKKSLIEFYSKKGFWAFHFRYRGSWESDGLFLQKSPTQDLIDVVEGIPKGFQDSWSQKKFKFTPDEIIVVSGSFGGAAGVLASKHPKINKVVAVSPLLDWQNPGPDEPYPKMIRYFEEGYGQGHRFVKNGWDKLKSGKFYNPIAELKNIDGSKILIIHAKDDRTCPYRITKKFSKDVGAKLITLPKGDHLGSSILALPRFHKLFQNFIKQK